MITNLSSFGFSYEYEGEEYSFAIVAASLEEAKGRAAAMAGAKTVGEIREDHSSSGASREEWESLYDSREAERAKREKAEAQLEKIATHIEESAYYGSVTREPRGAAKVLHEVLALANTGYEPRDCGEKLKP